MHRVCSSCLVEEFVDFGSSFGSVWSLISFVDDSIRLLVSTEIEIEVIGNLFYQVFGQLLRFITLFGCFVGFLFGSVKKKLFRIT